MLTSLGSLYVRGAYVDWKSFDEPYQLLKIALPTYPFERERCWENAPELLRWFRNRKSGSTTCSANG